MKDNRENNNPNLYKKSVLTTKEAAKLLNVGVQTIKNYIYQGKIKSFKTPGGHHRIFRSDLPAQLEDTFKAHTDPHETYLVIIKALVKALEMRDMCEDTHSDVAVRCSLKMAEHLNLSDNEKKNIELASLLRDIGKIAVSEQILGKPGKLTEQEFAAIKEHPKIAERIVGDIRFLERTKPLIRHHHESFNGSGYPDGLKGEGIPLGARIIAIAGVYQALVSRRPYREAFSKKKATDILKENSGSQFDPKLVELFLEMV